MTSKTFLNDFITNMDADDILGCQYVVISNEVRTNGKWDNIQKGNNLYPKSRICSDYMNGSISESAFEDEYIEMLKDEFGYIAILASYVMNHGTDIIFIFGKDAKTFPFVKPLCEFITELTGLPVYDFKKCIRGQEKEIDYDEDVAIQKINSALKKMKKKQDSIKMRTSSGRKSLIESMGKKEMKKYLKKMGLYSDGMSKKEMRSDLLEYFVDE